MWITFSLCLGDAKFEILYRELSALKPVVVVVVVVDVVLVVVVVVVTGEG